MANEQLTGEETAPGVEGMAPGQPQLNQQQPPETAGNQIDPYRPTSGISSKLYDFTKYVETSPVIQGAVGGAARLGIGYATGGVSELAGTAIGAGAGGLTKGIAGQLRQFLSVRQQQEQAQAQQSAVAQPLQARGY